MKRSDRMERINAINNGIKTIAGADLARVEAEYTTQVNQLEQLRIYKEEYSEQLKQRLASNVSSDAIQDYRYFFPSLYRAIGQQESIVNHLRAQLDAARQDWLAKDQEVHKLNTLSDNLRRSEAITAARLDQKRMDEMPLPAHGGFAIGGKH